MEKEVVQAINEASSGAAMAIRDYFRADGGSDNKKVDRALTLFGRVNGMESNRIKVAALQLQVAKAAGIKGEALRPLFAELSGHQAPQIASGEMASEQAAPLEAKESAA